jgi:hypothetical protein
MRNAPLVSRVRGIGAFDLPDGSREIFFARGLDHPNHFEPLRENRFLAHAVFGGRPIAGAGIERDLPEPRTRKRLKSNENSTRIAFCAPAAANVG